MITENYYTIGTVHMIGTRLLVLLIVFIFWSFFFTFLHFVIALNYFRYDVILAA